eukprot:15158362-Ditylum_brightwellii.AAC.2
MKAEPTEMPSARFWNPLPRERRHQVHLAEGSLRVGISVGKRIKKEEGSGIMWAQLWESWVVCRKTPIWDYIVGFNVGVQKGLWDG